jgi:nucleotide-binding universal stress UspA family protein
VGAGNRSRMSRLLLGSVSTKILHTAPISALIVHRTTSPTGTPLKVLFGTDGSEYANLGLAQMVELLNPATCSINVVSVAEHLMPSLSFPIPRVGYATHAPTPEKEKEWIAAAEGPARNAAKKLDEAGFETEVKVVLGAPTSQLLAEVDEIKADLVVIGSRGLGTVERAALGSVSGQIVNEAPATLVARS